MTENICRLNYGILKAINYKRSILKILEKLFRAKGKGDSDIPYKDRYFLQGAKLVFFFLFFTGCQTTNLC